VTGGLVHITGAGSCTITASQAGDGNYNAAQDVPQSFTINKAASTTTVAVSNVTYDGQPHGGTASVTGFGGLSQNLVVTYVGRNGTSYLPSSTAPTNAGDYTASASFSGDANHDGSNDSKDFSIAKAHATITLSNLTATFDGTAKSATATTSPDGLSGVAITYDGSATAPTNAGSYAVVATLTNGNYDAPQATGTLVVAKAASQTQVTCPSTPQVFTGSAQTPCSAQVTGAGNLSATVAPTYTNNVHAGTASASASFGGDANHDGSSGSATFTISKASSTTVVTASNATYDGQSHGATATATGAGDLSTAVTAINYTGTTAAGAAYSSSTAPTDAGTYVATATFAGDDDHTASTGTANFSIAKATPTVTATGGSFTYDGTAHAGSGSATGVGSASLGPVTVYYTGTNGTNYPQSTTAPTHAGSYSVVAKFGGDGNYIAGESTPVTLQIGKATATVVVNGFSVQYDGQPHSATGTVTGVPGDDLSGLLHISATFTDVPGGTGTWTFDGNSDYNASNGSVTITITQAPSATTVSVSDATYDGNAHGGSASVTGAGTLNQPLDITYAGVNGTTYGPSTTAPTNAGHYTASAKFDGDVNHSGSNDSKTFTIQRAVPTVTVTGGSFTYDGTAHAGSGAATGVGGVALTPAVTLTYVGTGATTYASSSTAPTDAGTYAVTASFAGNDNYIGGSSSAATLTIAKADATINVQGFTGTYDGSAHGASGSATGVNGTDLSSLLNLGDSFTNVSGGTANWSFAGNNNYNSASGSVTITINKASSTTTVSVANATYDGNAHGGTASVTGAGGLSQTLPVSYVGRNATVYGPSATAPTNAGDYAATANFTGDNNHGSSSDSKNFSIAKATSATTVTCPAGPFVYNGSAFQPCSANATGNGGLNQAVPVSYTNNVHAGTATATASYPGDANHEPSQTSSATFTILQAPQLITFPTIADHMYGDAPFTISASGGASGNPVTFTTDTPQICTVSGNTVTIIYSSINGSPCTIRASQAGSGDYLPATPVTQSFQVTPWSVRGFYQPVDMTPAGGQTVWNTVKGGSTVPLKFQVFAGSVEITDPAKISGFTTRQVACAVGTEVATDSTVATGGTTLRYDATAHQFIYNWQTPKTSNACYVTTMTTNGGSYTLASFKTK
jgi:hypothetical protein